MSPGLENCTVWCRYSGGADEIRTRDPLLAKQVLYQLSYDPRRDVEKERIFEIYFVRSTETRTTCQILRFGPSSFDHRREALASLLPSP